MYVVCITFCGERYPEDAIDITSTCCGAMNLGSGSASTQNRRWLLTPQSCLMTYACSTHYVPNAAAPTTKSSRSATRGSATAEFHVADECSSANPAIGQSR